MTDYPTGSSIIAENRGGLIGKAVDRVDGWSKVTGGARYSAEIDEAGKVLYGVIVTAPIGKGRISALDVAAAEDSPGIELVLTHLNAPPQGAFGAGGESNAMIGAKPFLDGVEIRAFGTPIACVIADTFENARAAAALVRADYQEEPGAFGFEANLGAAALSPSGTAKAAAGDFEAAFAAAPVQLDEHYATPAHNHVPMEPHATTADWDGDKLTVWTSIQGLKGARHAIATTLQLPKEKVRVISRFIGGGFGGKAHVDAPCILAAIAARQLGRPVRIAMTRPQMFHLSTRRSAARQHVRLGADRDGRITALSHDGVMHSARYYDFTENVAGLTRSLYPVANLSTRHDLVRLDAPMACAVRAPGGAVGTMAIEAAMDELAHRLSIDPIELRIRNEPTIGEGGRPFSSRSLVSCLREGAARFGWERRNPTPGATREGNLLIGMGMGSAIWHTLLFPARAAISLNADGTATIRQAMTDIGTGTYTILAQIAATALGLKTSDIHVEIGDSDFPAAPGSGGSFGAATSGSAVLDAAMAVRRMAIDLATGEHMGGPLFGQDGTEAVFADGNIIIGNQGVKITDLLSWLRPQGLQAEGRIEVPADYWGKVRNAHGANFAEVSVDTLTGEVRLRRMLGVFAAGRILNEKTARSQALGGMIWGVGAALMEENHFDPRYGSFAAQDLANYHMPVHADIVNLEALFLPEDGDDNPLGIKGVGELGICGAGAAIANAVFNACDVRVRDYPLTAEKVLAGLTA
ncbi:MAG: xanthine dehydrogenase family protein molybdopterin-binding subunit [Alphaproteobacteria bacterium]